MCGRFALHASEAEIVSHFHLKTGFSMRPRYNIAPTQTIPIIRIDGEIEFFRWGFIPSWAPSDHINAKWETLSEKPTFKTAFKQQRCLIPASGYYEWKTFSGKKQPYYIYLKKEPLFAYAGIWSSTESCAIITTQAPDFLQKIHERMPLIISSDKYALWLSSENRREVLETMGYGLTPEKVGIHPVTSRMGNPRFEGIECINSLQP